MTDISIGQIARRAGVRTSTIRYYESEGLIPAPARRSGQRKYDTDILPHLLFVRTALRSGFTISEIKPLVKGLTPAAKPGDRWRAVAGRKLGDLDRQIETLQAKKRLLQNLVKCECASLSDFARGPMGQPAKD